jgi:phosphoglycolate phosphatase
MPNVSKDASWMGSDAYLFDIDGTLLRNRDRVHYDALNRALREVYGADTTIAGVRFHGMTDVGILRAALARVEIGSQEFERRLPAALACVREHVDEHAGGLNPLICDGIPQVLEMLHRSGKLVGVASGNLESVGWQKIEATGLRSHFRFGVFCDDHELRVQVFARGVAEVRSRLGNESTACFVGDTPQDIVAAQQAGGRIISVCTGIYKREDLEPLGPDFCVCSCAELVSTGARDTVPLRP